MSILHPLTPRLTTRHTLLVILLIWTVSIVICSPDVALINFKQTPDGPQCYVGKKTPMLIENYSLQEHFLVFYHFTYYYINRNISEELK